MSARKILVLGAMMCVSTLLSGSATGALGDATAVDNYTVGFYAPAQMAEFGTPVEYVVLNNGSYAGLASRVTASIAGSHLSPAEEDRIYRDPDPYPYPMDPPYQTPISTFMGTEMIIRGGTNTSGSETTVTMAWRTRTEIEVDARGYPIELYYNPMQMPPAAYDSYGMVGDIVDVSGVVGAHVLESEYDDASLIYEQPGFDEELYASTDRIYLGWLEDEAHKSGGALADYIEWVHATDGNTPVGTETVIENYQGSYDDFVAEYTDFTAAGYLGSYGVDIVDNTVWAVINHNSQFGAVPEPASVLLLSLGLPILCGRRVVRRHKR